MANEKPGKYAGYNKPKLKEIRKTVQNLQKEAGNKPDSRREFQKAGHAARDDYQKAGSPYGKLSGRTPPRSKGKKNK